MVQDQGLFTGICIAAQPPAHPPLSTLSFPILPLPIHSPFLSSILFLYGLPPFSPPRVRPKFGFGYGAETSLTYGFGLISATAKVHWHKFGFGRNITPKRRNRTIGTNCNTGRQAVSLLAVGGQGGAYASWYRRPET